MANYYRCDECNQLIRDCEIIGDMLFCPSCNGYLTEESDEAVRRLKEEEDRLRRLKEEDAARKRRYKDEQKGYFDQMVDLNNGSISLFESLPKKLIFADKHLDQAEVDFADGAFVPFWESIEKAVKELGGFDAVVNQIKYYSSQYNELIQKYENTPPEFPIAPHFVKKLDAQVAVVNRLQSIIRKAQRDFQFSTIYMQFKTNQILVAGFRNLGQALDQVTWQIADSIGGLASSICDMTSTINKSMGGIHSLVGDILETSQQHHKQRMEVSSNEVARAKKALEMLDNIQRDRRPFIW